MELEKRLESTVSFENMSENDEWIGVWGKFNMGTKESEIFTNQIISRTVEGVCLYKHWDLPFEVYWKKRAVELQNYY